MVEEHTKMGKEYEGEAAGEDREFWHGGRLGHHGKIRRRFGGGARER